MMETAIALAGTGSAIALINKVSDAIGWYTAPRQEIRMTKAKAEAELIRARSRAESGNVVLDNLVQRAEFRAAVERILEQSNLENTIVKALSYLNEDAAPQDMDNDWIKNHIDKCKQVSDDEMQEWWAKILAGEANNPGSYSKKTVNVLGDLEQTEAQMFTALCNLVWTIGNEPIPLVYDIHHSIYTNAGVTGRVCTYLKELGLVNYEPPILNLGQVGQGVTANYHHHRVNITSTTNSRGLITGHVALTLTGMQLFGLCVAEPVDGFFEYVLEEWRKQGASLQKLERRAE